MQLLLPDGAAVSALLQVPQAPRAALVLAHGAGAGMQHSFMSAVADGLAARSVATLRFNFPSMERGASRPDTPAVAHAAVRAAVLAARAQLPGVPLFAGGKSFGGRMTSQAQALSPLDGVCGLVFFGFPLHPAGKPSTSRADHLSAVRVPMLFLQGTRDALSEPALIGQVTHGLGTRATLHPLEGADHAFHVLVRSGRTDPQVLDETLDTAARWMARCGAPA
jgi:predicted alpha/beta-hydrolase family hydrolase